MLFNSFEFAVFFPAVFLVYWFAVNNSLKNQNIFLLIASYFFYGWWDCSFLLLLGLLSIANYLIGIEIENNDKTRKRKFWLISGLIINIGVLGVFKYYNFFVDSFIDLVSLSGYDLPRFSTTIILPLGISFYTFLSLSYIIDIYKQNLKANKNIVEVLLALSFFPIILAGPIQRPATLLPQITRKREFKYEQAVDGLRQILWGLFAKMVVADNLALRVDQIFSNFSEQAGSTLAVGAIFYSVQIYADFSGYSNISIGIAKLLGFRLMQNFSYPYFSRDISEFWKRWHISLVTWFRDYLFLPISFALSWKIKNDKVLKIKSDLFIYIVASSIVWFLTGLWHGANYTFILWGIIHGLFLIIYHWQKRPRKRILKKIGINEKNYLIAGIETLITLVIVIISWVIFRADSINYAYLYILKMFSSTLFTIPNIFAKEIIFVMIFISAEWLQRSRSHGMQIETIRNRIFRWALYCLTVILIFYFAGKEQQFIYFQF